MVNYDCGIAFIVEGATEKVFYSEYILDVAGRLTCSVSSVVSSDPIDYVLEAGGKRVLVKIHDVGTVSQMTNAGIWFQRACKLKHPQTPWHVFLAYDTDEYNCPVSKFHQGDWMVLRRDLVGAVAVTDLAAEADIEDIMLCDLPHILKFLQLPPSTPLPSGGKGKSKMKRLYKMVAAYHAYHEGWRAKELICALDFEEIARKAPIPLRDIDKAIGAAFQ